MKKLLVSFITGVVVIGVFVAFSGIIPPEDAKRELAVDLPAQQQDANEPPDTGSDQRYHLLEGTELLLLDEAAQNPDFLQFRYELLEALKLKDLAFIKAHIDDTIRYSFGVNDGVTGFLESWALLDNPEKSDFWTELSEVINLGGSFDAAGSFVAPYVYSKFPESIDAFQNSAVVSDAVKLYSQPNTDSEVIGLLNYNIVQVTAERQVSLWQKVTVSDGVAGYVQSKYLRSPIDYRAMFAKKDGTWKMVFFVAGD